MEEKSVRFVNIDHDTPMLLPPELRDWVSPGHMVHFVMDALVALDLSRAHTNERGTGSAQYPPSMMLGLLIYSYATGTFSSRRIETLTYENVAVRFLLRGREKAGLEWTLVATSYKLKRLFNLGMAIERA